MTEELRPASVLVEGFGFRYAGRTEWAVRDAEIRIEPGERILLTGASGSGKSTLLAAMAGLLGPDAGDSGGAVRIDGRPAAQARDRVGIVFQDPDSQLVMSRAGDDVAFGLENRAVPTDEIWPRVRATLQAVGFGFPLDRSTHALSGGEKQRLVLAGALVAEPGLLLLDEPTSQLDPEGARLVRDAVARILHRRETTLVLIDHDAAPWLPFIDRVLEVPFGLTQGTPATLGMYQGAPESIDPARGGHEPAPIPAGAGGGVRELAADWRPVLPTLPPRPAALDAGPMAREPLRAERAGFRFPGDPIDGPALVPTDVGLTAGTVTAITGPNGSGKSTLGLLLSGLKAPTVGRIVASPDLAGRLGSKPPHRWPAADLVQRIGTVFQNPEHQFLTGRVRDELSLGPLRAGTGNSAAHARSEELLAALGLTAYADANPFTLSGGQQRRLSVATALATDPAVLVLDEPTFGQDPATWEELVGLLARARDAGAALCLISHDPRLITGFADHEIRLALPTAPDAVDHRNSGGFSGPKSPKTPLSSDDQLGPGRTR